MERPGAALDEGLADRRPGSIDAGIVEQVDERAAAGGALGDDVVVFEAVPLEVERHRLQEAGLTLLDDEAQRSGGDLEQPAFALVVDDFERGEVTGALHAGAVFELVVIAASGEKRDPDPLGAPVGRLPRGHLGDLGGELASLVRQQTYVVR